MAFRKSIGSFSDLSVDKRLENITSFLKEIDSVIDFEKLRPILLKNGIGTKNVCGNKAYDALIMFKILGYLGTDGLKATKNFKSSLMSLRASTNDFSLL